MILRLAAAGVVPFSGTGPTQTNSAADNSGLLGWIVAGILGLALVWHLMSGKFEVREKTITRNMMVQGPVTYKINFSTTGENRSRFQVLPEHDFGAWQTMV